MKNDRKTIKTLTIILGILLIIFFLGATTNVSLGMDLGTIKNQADGFIDKGQAGATITQKEAVQNLIPVGRVLVQIATIVLVIVGLIIGLKYMMSGADEKAKMKEKLIWYVISIVLVYGAVGIFNIVINVMNEILK